MCCARPNVANENSEKERIKLFSNLVENAINTSVLGDSRSPCQFRIPMETNRSTGKSQIGTISLENTKVRSIIENLSDLISTCISCENKKLKWITMTNDYNHALKILRRKGLKHTEDELKNFQFKIDSFANMIVPMFGKRTLTNYIHDLISGHAMEHMKEWGCLCRYSQQGWEALNSLVKTTFFRRTNRGGTQNSMRSKLVPVARVFQRRLLWLSGLGDDILNGNNIDHIVNDLIIEREQSNVHNVNELENSLIN